MHHRKQPVSHDQLRTSAIRILVAGSRGYANYAEFSEQMWEQIDRWGFRERLHEIVFITGKARTGADDLIIEWCGEFDLDHAEFPADWNTHGKVAGYIRNTEMGLIATHLIVFWDGFSRGTKHMLQSIGVSIGRKARGKVRIPFKIVLVHIPKEEENGW